METIENLNLLSYAGALSIVATVAVAMLVVFLFRKSNQKLESILKVLLANSGELKGVVVRTEQIMSAHQVSYEEQSKISEHQQVLIRSLHMQIKNLETALNPNAGPLVSTAHSTLEGKQGNSGTNSYLTSDNSTSSENNKSDKYMQQSTASAEKEVVLLKYILQQQRGNAAFAISNKDQIERIRNIFPDSGDTKKSNQEEAQRRAING